MAELDVEIEPRCSFCGRTDNEAATMVKASSGVLICSTCIKDYVHLLSNESTS